MKKALTVSLAIVLCLLTQAAWAMDNDTLAGNTYDVIMLCLGESGDYCDGFGLQDETFIFHDGGYLQLDEFEENLWVGAGEYEQIGAQFEAEYYAIEDFFALYEIEIDGYVIGGSLVLGIMDIEYYEFELGSFDWEKEDDVVALFLGFVQ